MVKAATDLDHIVPHKGDMVLFWSPGNWQSLCHACHSRKTMMEDGGMGNAIKASNDG
jgi:5-methylcytosine-specific restriction protein A